MATSFFNDLMQTLGDRGRSLLGRVTRGPVQDRRPGRRSPRRCCRAAARPPAWRSPARCSTATRRRRWPCAARLPDGARGPVRRRIARSIDAAVAYGPTRRRDNGDPGAAGGGRGAPAGAVPPPQPCARRHRRAGAHAGRTHRPISGQRPDLRDVDDAISPTYSRPGSTAASSCCGRSTGRRPPTSWRRSSATRPCTTSTAGTTCVNRLEPPDRRCFAFFHPQLVDEPLIFVEVALTTDMPGAIAPLLDPDRVPDPAGGRDDRRLLLDLQHAEGAGRASRSVIS